MVPTVLMAAVMWKVVVAVVLKLTKQPKVLVSLILLDRILTLRLHTLVVTVLLVPNIRLHAVAATGVKRIRITTTISGVRPEVIAIGVITKGIGG